MPETNQTITGTASIAVPELTPAEQEFLQTAEALGVAIDDMDQIVKRHNAKNALPTPSPFSRWTRKTILELCAIAIDGPPAEVPETEKLIDLSFLNGSEYNLGHLKS